MRAAPSAGSRVVLVAAALACALGTSCVVAGPVEPYQPLPGTGPVPDASDPALDPSHPESFVDAYIEKAKGSVVGAAVAVVMNGETVFLKGYGDADREKGVKVDAGQTLFRVGSLSKMLTWTALMQQVQAHRIDLDADVNRYLTCFRVPEAFGKPVRVRDLLTHTAGFEDNKLGWTGASPEAAPTSLCETLGNHIPARVFPPGIEYGSGENAAYSNWGAALAGHLVEEVTGQSFDEYVEQNILKPLDMPLSTFREPLDTDRAGRMAAGYTRSETGHVAKPFEIYRPIAPASSFTATAGELTHFMIAHLQLGAYRSTRILEEGTARSMQERAFGSAPYLNGSGLGFFETWRNGHRIVHHSGLTAYFSSEMALIPDLQLGVLILANTKTPATEGFAAAFLDAFYPATLPHIEPKPFSPSDYVGSYIRNSNSYTKTERLVGLLRLTEVTTSDGMLEIASLLSPKESPEWICIGPDVFRHVGGQETIRFVRDAKGRVTHLVSPKAFSPLHRLSGAEQLMAHTMAAGLMLREVLHNETVQGSVDQDVIAVLALLFGAFFVAIVRALPRPEASAAPSALRGARILAAANAILNLLVLDALAATVDVLQNDFVGALTRIPLPLKIASILGTLSALSAAAMLWQAARSWRSRTWTIYGRIEYTAITLITLVFAAWLHYGNLVGWNHT